MTAGQTPQAQNAHRKPLVSAAAGAVPARDPHQAGGMTGHTTEPRPWGGWAGALRGREPSIEKRRALRVRYDRAVRQEQRSRVLQP